MRTGDAVQARGRRGRRGFGPRGFGQAARVRALSLVVAESVFPLAGSARCPRPGKSQRTRRGVRLGFAPSRLCERGAQEVAVLPGFLFSRQAAKGAKGSSVTAAQGGAAEKRKRDSHRSRRVRRGVRSRFGSLAAARCPHQGMRAVAVISLNSARARGQSSRLCERGAQGVAVLPGCLFSRQDAKGAKGSAVTAAQD